MPVGQFDMEAIQETIAKLLYAPSPEAASQVVREHPELLSEQADRVLKMIIGDAKAKGNEDITNALENRREFLQAVRHADHSHAGGNPESKHPEPDNEPPDLREALQALANSPDPEQISAVVAQHPVLLSEQADAMFEMMVSTAKAQGDDKTAHFFEMLRELMKRFKKPDSQPR